MLPTDLLLDPGSRQAFAGAAAIGYALLCTAIWLRGRRQARARAALNLTAQGSPAWLVAYASQTGTAEALALAAGRHLHQAGLAAQVVELNQLTAAQLRQTERALFIVSTYGEGDAPDNAALFAAQCMAQTLPLRQLHYALLALGDASYVHYCGFGRALEHWLQACDAQALQPRIEVDRDDAAAIEAWQGLLTQLAGSSDAPDWSAPPFEDWQLQRRLCLNPGSQGAPLYEIALVPAAGALPDWASGDLAQLCFDADPTRPREYSIASLPAEGELRLLVRLHRDAAGRYGLASGWLAQAEPGARLRLRVRPHRLFRLGANAERPLILIGNGSGLAGLRGHLKARVTAGRHDNWLIYGERKAAHDAIWAAEFDGWYAAGALQRLDRVFSRDGGEHRYVQDVLRAAADQLREWVAAGAAIYVCGGRQGMAEDVHRALHDLLGELLLEELLRSGRYRRDVY